MFRNAAVFSFVLLLPAAAAAQDDVARGQTLVEENCATCHAASKEGLSPLSAAPPFRTLGQRYPVSNLEEALAEGIVTAHPEMPQLAFEPDEVSAIIAYLESIQEM
jgi:mono/diheme cytochrome c family protein